MALIKKINDKKVWVFDKEESLLGIEKSLTRTISEFDSKTEEMVEQLHQARNKQVNGASLNFYIRPFSPRYFLPVLLPDVSL